MNTAEAGGSHSKDGVREEQGKAGMLRLTLLAHWLPGLTGEW